MAASELTAGDVLGDGRYRLERRLGAGGMATVWQGHDERLGRPVAVKVIADVFAADQHYHERFEREARAAASVSHPNIVRLYDYGVHDDRPFLIMEYISGGSLADRLGSSAPATLDVMAFADQLLRALDCIHRAGLVHRDVKPANIMLDAAGRARLTDFGIAQPEGAESLTQTGMVVGTLRYLAPEILTGTPATAASDLYATGMVLRELTKQQPTPQLAALITNLSAANPLERAASAHAALELIATSAVPSTPRTAETLLAANRPGNTSIAPVTDSTRRMSADTPAARHAITPRAALTAAGAVAFVLVMVIALSSGGDGAAPTKSKTTPASPAPASAPLDAQLTALRQLVDQAAEP